MSGAPSETELAADLARGSADLRYLLTQNRVKEDAQATLFKAGVDTVAKFLASFTSEDDLRGVLKRDFSIDVDIGLANRALAASFVVAWQAAQARIKGHAELEAEPLSEVLSRDEIDPEILVPQWDSKGAIVLKKASSKGALPTGPGAAPATANGDG